MRVDVVGAAQRVSQGLHGLLRSMEVSQAFDFTLPPGQGAIVPDEAGVDVEYRTHMPLALIEMRIDGRSGRGKRAELVEAVPLVRNDQCQRPLILERGFAGLQEADDVGRVLDQMTG